MTQNDPSRDSEPSQSTWRGVDFSGLTLVLGAGGGRLVDVLAEQVRQADGHLAVVDYQMSALRELEPGGGRAMQRLRARYRQLPLLAESVDLLVVNGVLREAPEARFAALFEEFWRVLVQGGRLRISDVLEPSEADYDRTWRQRNSIVRALAALLGKPAALAVDLTAAAKALRQIGFEDLSVALLPGLALTEAWLEETVNAVRSMAARLVDRSQRDQIIECEVPKLIEAFAAGNQRAAERFVLSGHKVGSLALDMEASFTEDDLSPQE